MAEIATPVNKSCTRILHEDYRALHAIHCAKDCSPCIWTI